VVTDVDGTLLTREKLLTSRARDAVRRLRDAGIGFTLASSRPPRGLQALIEALGVSAPLAAFNGGMIVLPDLTVLRQHLIEQQLAQRAAAVLDECGVDVWVYRGEDWFVPALDGVRVRRESEVVGFAPRLLGEREEVLDSAVKIVAVSDDGAAIVAAERALNDCFGRSLSIMQSHRSYIDVTHPDANKGDAVGFLSQHFSIPTEAVATLGDMPSDVPMFARSGVSFAMGNAARDVQQAAKLVTASNEDEGFAAAVERLLAAAT
jgi:hypothetical protein